MRYQLDTIPVWDALKEDTECPPCALRDKNERMYVESFLGASVMEPSTRVEVNQKGFCAAHFAQMFREKNRLGLALITDTYMQDVTKSVAGILGKPAAPRRLFGGDAQGGQGAAIRERIGQCVLCERLENTMQRYAYTLVHLYDRDKEFKEALLAGKGLCLPHLADALDMAKQQLGSGYQAFTTDMAALTERNLERVEQELAWFTQKSDYRNHDKPWGESKDAPERAIQKVAGRAKGGQSPQPTPK